jgi:hypothetical protein
VKRSKGDLSESERVNRLLRFALDVERKAALEREAAQFFAAAPRERAERKALQKATKTVLARE